jgi:hypothetical protein
VKVRRNGFSKRVFLFFRHASGIAEQGGFEKTTFFG